MALQTARLYVSAITLLFLAACGPSAQEQEHLQRRAAELDIEVKALKSEVERLKAELEDTRFGAERLLSQAKSSFEASKDSEARTALIELLKRHPGTTESKEGSALLQRVDELVASFRHRRTLSD